MKILFVLNAPHQPNRNTGVKVGEQWDTKRYTRATAQYIQLIGGIVEGRG
jgi:hypothetical protein